LKIADISSIFYIINYSILEGRVSGKCKPSSLGWEASSFLQKGVLKSMKTVKFLPMIVGLFFLFISLSSDPVLAQNLRARLLENAGKTFAGMEDPAYQSYDQALRDYVAQRINKRYGVAIDPKGYNGFDLLDIEAFLKCKKSNEALSPYLQKFQKK
jgi:hypothetical protein